MVQSIRRFVTPNCKGVPRKWSDHMHVCHEVSNWRTSTHNRETANGYVSVEVKQSPSLEPEFRAN